ncbi:MAG: MarR family transcriptional regulator [Akkermansiaceae bacterium]|jgi:DNA-binding MarR family transcriptional regulator|nr:MarR family transcriptional regulator [Akkermansiaceae bacterium]MBJ7285465.1 MarR family transcriptional regulator [Akkermansiaceae bacterium]MBJ7396408.1 MarR family transcriptional regulator [Akkermansiaceae bacterium]MBJ7424289.1 MarR family transcriptional regulator [Akkermansiaceae bacterium]
MKTMNASGASVKADADRLADFVLFTQRSCILNLSSELNKGNVSFPQFFLLTYLSSEDYLTMSDIAKKMGHSTAAATGLVDRLEKLSYVERIHAAEDRRKIMVRITAKGIELVSKMRTEIANDLVGILAGMDEDQAETVEHTKRAIRGRAIA